MPARNHVKFSILGKKKKVKTYDGIIVTIIFQELFS